MKEDRRDKTKDKEEKKDKEQFGAIDLRYIRNILRKLGDKSQPKVKTASAKGEKERNKKSMNKEEALKAQGKFKKECKTIHKVSRRFNPQGTIPKASRSTALYIIGR